MDAAFWQQRWAEQQIGFHLPTVNPYLVQHLHRLQLASHSRVFLPLCGKTLDIAWLLAQGYQVVGVECSALAVEALFAEAQLTPSVHQVGTLACYQAPNLVVWQGDFFALTPAHVGRVDAVYDRAALIALPPAMRVAYAKQLRQLAPQVPQLLVTLSYTETSHAGPPFSVSADEVATHYAADYQLTCCQHAQLPTGLKGRYPAEEQVWHLLPITQAP